MSDSMESSSSTISPSPAQQQPTASTTTTISNATVMSMGPTTIDPTTTMDLTTTMDTITGGGPVESNTPVIYAIVGLACGIALVITFVLLILCVLVWRKKIKEMTATPSKERMESCSTVKLTDVNEDEANEETEEEILRREPILIADFSESVKKKHFNANIAFEDEFESLSTRHKSSYSVAKQKHNESKNRFENIFPYDFSRVVLKQLENREGADYINASFINGYSRENAYIAAQGPLKTTVADFWRMVWEQRITAIIMLTETIEAGREKCAQYWPALMDTPWNVGDNLSVTLQMQTQYAAYRVKKILLENENADTEGQIVTHFHFSAWPDHGVPADKTCLIQFIQRVRKDFPYYESPPIIVHCSAGVGRSGTFIVLDSMLERMKVEDSFDIYAFICEMRRKRALMVQTEAQYSFIHDALDEYLTCGDTSIAVTNLRVAIVNLSKLDSSGKSGYCSQFELLEKVSYKRTTINCNEAEKEYNMEKNRYKDHVPYNMNRVFLRAGGAVKGAEYINASFIDGYKHRKNFIATQGPLKNTVNEFWRMVWEQKNRVIVQLCNLEEEDDEESCHRYWPDNERTCVYGKLKVKMIKEDEKKYFTVRKFEIGEDTPYMAPGAPDAIVITQFHHTKWPRKGPLPSSVSILEMMNSLLKIQMSTGNHAIIVMCNDGIGRTGTFTTIYSQIERIKAEQMSDIFQYIKARRFQRANMVLEEAQFRFCHQVLADYLNSVDNYANFKDL